MGREIASLSGAKRGLKHHIGSNDAADKHRFALRSEARIETAGVAVGEEDVPHRFALRSEARIETRRPAARRARVSRSLRSPERSAD